MDPHLERLRNAITQATAGMTTDQLADHPDGKWCAAEVLEHLSLTYSGTAITFKRGIDAGAPQVRPATFREQVATALVVEAGHMPAGREAPPMTKPKGISPAESISHTIGKLDEMAKIIEEARARFGSKVKVAVHPILGPLTVKQWCKFHWVHGRHHLKQIERLKKQFPIAGRHSPATGTHA